MPDKDKQIEEMAKEICAKCKSDTKCSRKICTMAYREAEHLFDKGYRKAEDVAREIFEEIEKMLLDNHIESFKNLNDEWVHRFKESLMKMLAELKKKYTEDGK